MYRGYLWVDDGHMPGFSLSPDARIAAAPNDLPQEPGQVVARCCFSVLPIGNHWKIMTENHGKTIGKLYLLVVPTYPF